MMEHTKRNGGKKMQAIRTTSLTKHYQNLTAVDQLDLEIRQGELFSLLGVNGAGKTTTIKMLTGLTRPTGGDAYVGGHSITESPEKVKALIGVSPQETAVAPGLSVQENLQLMCGVHGFDKAKSTAKIEELTELLSLGSVLKRKAGKLSGGWQRRLSIAMASSWLLGFPSTLFSQTTMVSAATTMSSALLLTAMAFSRLTRATSS